MKRHGPELVRAQILFESDQFGHVKLDMLDWTCDIVCRDELLYVPRALICYVCQRKCSFYPFIRYLSLTHRSCAPVMPIFSSKPTDFS